MITEFLKRLLRRNPPPASTGLIAVPANIPVPQPPANDPTPIKVRLMSSRPVLRFVRNDATVLPGSTVVTRNKVEMKVARADQKPPYVVCVYKNRRLVVRAETIGTYWTTVEDIQ